MELAVASDIDGIGQQHCAMQCAVMCMTRLVLDRPSVLSKHMGLAAALQALIWKI